MSQLPRLSHKNHWVRSAKDIRYNCIAWAVGEDDRWWWPSEQAGYFWPEAAPEEVTLDAFAAAFATIGYTACSTALVEKGFEKIALYATGNKPTHAARQLPNGRWVSKLGFEEDIEHTLDAVNGPVYGSVVRFFKRPIREK